MSYTHTTLSALRTQLANRLGDAGMVFFVSDELDRCIKEGLRVWNACAQYFRERGSFETVSGTAFYDLDSLEKDSTVLLERTVEDADLATEIKYHLIEPVPTDYSTFTEQFSAAQITNALEKRRNQFLVETGMILSTSTINVPSPSTPQVSLSDSIIDIRRVAFKDTDSHYTNLWETSEKELTSFFPSWTEQGAPEAYSRTLTPNVALRIVPPPQDVGHLHLITVNAGANLNPASGIVLGVPDDFGWVIKYGALCDLLSQDGIGRDIERAEYCDIRWKEGVQLARLAQSCLHGEINGVATDIDSLVELDAYNPTWQHTTGSPNFVGQAGFNLVALSPVPDGIYSVVMDVVRNAPLPTLDDDYIQVGREYLDILVGYAAHVALFKCGGREFAESVSMYESLLSAAVLHNNRLRAEKFESLENKEEKGRPRMAAA